MKRSYVFLAALACVLALGAALASCDDGSSGSSDLPVKSIIWETDSDGFVQYYTNETAMFNKITWSALQAATTDGEGVFDCKKVSGYGYAGYGLILATSVTDMNDNLARSYYTIQIDTEGRFTIRKFINGNWASTPVVPWTPSAQLKRGKNIINRIRN
jgi:hypothetical protein